jgi:prepilin-type N-terminal cleavage/methylation domain-containing protein
VREHGGSPIDAGVRSPCRVTCHPSPVTHRAFTLIEILVVVTLLSLIVVSLMSVFSSTQRAFRASVTQSDVLEGGRAVMDLMAADVREMSPSFGNSKALISAYYPDRDSPVNFFANTNPVFAPPLVQTNTGTTLARTNVLEMFFILNKQNLSWTGTGYVVDNVSTNPINPLYRFSATTNAVPQNASILFSNFLRGVAGRSFVNDTTNWSHLIDGVVGLRLRAYDTNGVWLTNGYALGQTNSLKNVLFLPAYREVGFYMFSNSLPASVEIELATLEDRILQRAQSLPNDVPGSPPNDRRTLYLQNQIGKVHVFRQRVSIPNVDVTAYQ